MFRATCNDYARRMSRGTASSASACTRDECTPPAHFNDGNGRHKSIPCEMVAFCDLCLVAVADVAGLELSGVGSLEGKNETKPDTLPSGESCTCKGLARICQYWNVLCVERWRSHCPTMRWGLTTRAFCNSVCRFS